MISPAEVRKVFRIVERPKLLYVWGGKLLTITAAIIIVGSSLKLNTFERFSNDVALLSMIGMLLISGVIAGFYKKIVEIDRGHDTVRIKIVLLIRIYEKEYQLSQLGSPKITKEIASIQGADTTRAANTSHGARLYYLTLQKGSSSQTKREIRLKKYFKKSEVDCDWEKLTQYLNEPNQK